MKFNVIDSLNSMNSDGYYLIKSNWDDYKFRTNFTLVLFQDKNKTELGQVKIGRKGMTINSSTSDTIPNSFTELDYDYFSIGQEVSYYEKLNKLDDDSDEYIRDKIFKSLRDIAYDSYIYNDVKNEEVTKKSLLRWISETTIFGQYKRVINREIPLTEINFSFVIRGKNLPSTELEFKINPYQIPSTNVHAVIGKNGVGKTQFIKRLLLATTMKGNQEYDSFYTYFDDQKSYEINKIFSRILTISYSYFDDIASVISSNESMIKYDFFGLRTDRNNLIDNNYIDDVSLFTTRFKRSLLNCFSVKSKKKMWNRVMEIIDLVIEVEDLGISNLKYSSYDRLINNNSIEERFDKLSSGHKTVLSMLTKIIEIVEEKTFIIIDEPETHLHPPLLSSLIQALSLIMRDKNGVAFISTHSPVVIQEIPQSCCWIMNRYGDNIKFSRPRFETFGASINSIMREVFFLESEKSGFYQLIRKEYFELKSIEKVLTKFNHHLGDEAMAYLHLLEVIENEKN